MAFFCFFRKTFAESKDETDLELGRATIRPLLRGFVLFFGLK